MIKILQKFLRKMNKDKMKNYQIIFIFIKNKLI